MLSIHNVLLKHELIEHLVFNYVVDNFLVQVEVGVDSPELPGDRLIASPGSLHVLFKLSFYAHLKFVDAALFIFQLLLDCLELNVIFCNFAAHESPQLFQGRIFLSRVFL